MKLLVIKQIDKNDKFSIDGCDCQLIYCGLDECEDALCIDYERRNELHIEAFNLAKEGGYTHYVFLPLGYYPTEHFNRLLVDDENISIVFSDYYINDTLMIQDFGRVFLKSTSDDIIDPRQCKKIIHYVPFPTYKYAHTK